MLGVAYNILAITIGIRNIPDDLVLLSTSLKDVPILRGIANYINVFFMGIVAPIYVYLKYRSKPQNIPNKSRDADNDKDA